MSLDKKIKTAIDERDDLIKKADAILQKDNVTNRELEKVENLQGRIDEKDAFIDKMKENVQQRANNAIPYNDGSPGLQNGTLAGGKPLNQSGSIRAYKAEEKLQDSFGNDVDLGSYLRAIVDKPQTTAERELIQNSTTSGNYELPVHIASELIDRLRAANPLLMEGGAGARTVSIEGGETKFIKINSDPNSVWHAEMTEETPSDPSFGSVSMDPKTVLSMTEISRELLQDSANVEEALTTAFVGSINDAILSATFTGSGANTPTGLATTVTQTNTYTNGGTPDWTNFVGASRQLHDNNVPNDNRSFIHAPDVWESMALISDSNNRYQDAPSFIRDVPNFVSSGLSTGNAYVGDFSNVVYGFRLNITIEQHKAPLAKSYGTLWLAAARLDIATFRPNALVRIEEAAV